MVPKLKNILTDSVKFKDQFKPCFDKLPIHNNYRLYIYKIWFICIQIKQCFKFLAICI